MMPFAKDKDIQHQLTSLRKALQEHADPERAVNEKRYLKSQFTFFGVSLPATDKIAKDFRKAHKEATREHLIALVALLWDSTYHDEKRLGIRILQHSPEFLHYAIMPTLEKMLLQSTSWDLVDNISIHLVGTVIERDRRAYAYVKKWSSSDSFWMRRASLISPLLLFRKGGGDKKLFFRLAEAMLPEKEFFIRKAIGWGVREISKANPDEAFDFLMRVRERASGLILREGAKRLPLDRQRGIIR